MGTDHNAERGPLDGLRVLEFGQIAAGPFVGSLLADLGADVVKVEQPGTGDGMRQWPPRLGDDPERAVSANFGSLNRNKRSIAIDMKDPDDADRLRRLCASADVVVENFRPTVLARLGFDYETLAGDNPALVYCSISGYGQRGPYATRGAFDVTVQAVSGLMSVTGEEDGEPVKCGVPVGDFAAGLYAAYCVMSALLRARETGVGAYIDCSMLGSLLGVAALQTSEYYGNGRDPRALGSAHPRNAPYQAFHASDKSFVVAAGNERLWQRLCELIDRPELVDDVRFATQADRARNQSELVAVLAPIFARRTAAKWLSELERLGIPCAPINTYSEVLGDPQVQSMELVRDMTLSSGAPTKTVAFPVAMSGYRFAVRRRPPDLGEHTDEVLSEWLDSTRVPDHG